MPTITAATVPSDPASGNEDWYAATEDVVVVLDGATIRTDTGCVHGLRWYVHQLGTALLAGAASLEADLRHVLRDAIVRVRGMHADRCDLEHPGTPSAAVGIVRRNGDDIEWLVLADITVMVEHDAGLHVEADERVSATAPEKRAACHQFPIGSPEKLEAIVAMKHDELAARNVAGGYWVASVVPEAADHALVGSWPAREVHRVAACSDGAMRCLEMTTVNTHSAVMAVLRTAGPEWLIDYVRAAEESDPRRSEEHTSELQSRENLVCRLLLEK